MIELIPLIGSVFISFVIGSNDASNALSICIGSNVVKFNKAVVVFGLFVFFGMIAQGEKVMKTVGKDLLAVNISILGVSLIVSALLIAISNWKRLPLSSQQVIIGSLAGSGYATDLAVNMSSLVKIILSWIISPVGAFIFALTLYKIMEKTLSRLPLFRIEMILRILLVSSGMLVAYTTGANELATVFGGPLHAGLITMQQAYLVGPLLVFLGAVLLSSRVIETVGKGITVLDPFSGFAAQFGAATSVLVFTTLGMPISTTYCIIGGIVGVGVLKGMGTVRFELIKKMLISWVLTPLSAFALCFALTKALQYLPKLSAWM
jgi:phosphate/sulfate permease